MDCAVCGTHTILRQGWGFFLLSIAGREIKVMVESSKKGGNNHKGHGGARRAQRGVVRKTSGEGMFFEKSIATLRMQCTHSLLSSIN